MRNPSRKAAIFAGLMAFGAAIGWLGVQRREALGEDWAAATMLAAGFAIAPVAAWFLIEALLHARGRARLLGGHRRLADWRVSADEWQRFRVFDGDRGASDTYRLLSALWPRRTIPDAGVEVLVGETSVLVDGSYHVLRPGGLPELRRVEWLDNSAAAGRPPDCLEFGLSYPRGRYGGVQLFSLRVPFPSSARGQARQVFLHFAECLERQTAIARRDPRNNPKVIAGVLAAGLAMAAAGWLMAEATGWSTNETLVPAVLLIVGSVVSAFAGVVLLTLWLTSGSRRRYR